MQRYFLVWPLTDDAARLADVFAQQESEARQNRVCEHWSVPSSGDISLKYMDSTGASLSFISNDGTQLITDELKDRLEPEFSSRFQTSHVSLNGELLPHIQAFWDPDPAYLRAGKKSYCFRCPSCRRVFYDPRGIWHLVQAGLPESQIFATHYGGIVVHETLANRLLNRTWKKISIKPIALKGKPIDDFPANLEQLKPDEERQLILPSYEERRRTIIWTPPSTESP